MKKNKLLYLNLNIIKLKSCFLNSFKSYFYSIIIEISNVLPRLFLSLDYNLIFFLFYIKKNHYNKKLISVTFVTLKFCLTDLRVKMLFDALTNRSATFSDLTIIQCQGFAPVMGLLAENGHFQHLGSRISG